MIGRIIVRYDVAVCAKIVEHSRRMEKVKQRAAVRDSVEPKYNKVMVVSELECYPGVNWSLEEGG